MEEQWAHPETFAAERRRYILDYPRCLPSLCELMPAVLSVYRKATGGSGAGEVRSKRYRPLDERGTPVMTNEVKRFTEAVELVDKPVSIRFFCGVEAGGDGASKPRKSHGDNVRRREASG